MENVERVIRSSVEKKTFFLSPEAQEFLLSYFRSMQASDIRPEDVPRLETEIAAFDFQHMGVQGYGFLNPYFQDQSNTMLALALVSHDFKAGEINTMYVLFRLVCETIQFTVEQ